jgi:hypothetical protein
MMNLLGNMDLRFWAKAHYGIIIIHALKGLAIHKGHSNP